MLWQLTSKSLILGSMENSEILIRSLQEEEEEGEGEEEEEEEGKEGEEEEKEEER